MPVIAIDGPAASGKGTIARRLAAALGFSHLDTGSLYRVVALAVIRKGGNPADREAALKAVEAIDFSLLEDPALRSPETSEGSSTVAAIPEVRTAILAFQRAFAANPPGGKGAVIDGRDIGTIICPDAEVKLYVTAEPQTRARRRFLELRARGVNASETEVLADIQARDARDMNRPIAPLRQAGDAHLLDTTHLDIEAAVAQALKVVHAKLRT